MWDNPRILNIAAGALVGIASLALFAGAAHFALRSSLFPVLRVELTSAPQHTTRADIERALEGRIVGNFFALNLGHVRAAIEGLPWVRRVELRRVWPDRLQVAIEEHVALARWGDGQLLNVQGEVYGGRTDAELPLFIAPAGTQREVAWRYARFSRLVEPLGARVERVVLSPRLAWELRLDSGLHVLLGRGGEAAEERLRRFVEVYGSTLKSIPRNHEYVDLRYPNGFALRVAELKS
jgi:cell division protein FtsQ